MAQTIAELAVKITSDNSKLRRGLKQSQKSVTKFAKAARSSLNKFAKVGFIGVTAAIAGMVFQLGKASKSVDKLAKTSEKLGIGVAELQKLQFQAQLSGVKIETLNMALQRMVRRISEAAIGTGEAIGAIKELGINAQDLARLSPDKQFQRISEAFGEIGNQGDKVRLAMKLFDSEGVALVNTLGLNLAKTGKEFESFGISVSSSQAKAVEAFEDAQTKLSTIWQGFFLQMTAAIAPTFTKLIDHVILVVKEMGGMKVVAEQAADALINGFNRAIPTIKTLFTILKGTVGLLQTVGEGIGNVAGFVSTNVSKAAGFIGSNIDKNRQNINRFREADDPNFTSPLLRSSSISKAAQGSSTTNIPGATGGIINGKIAIIVSADNEAVIRRLEKSQSMRDVIITEVDRTTKSAARQVAR